MKKARVLLAEAGRRIEALKKNQSPWMKGARQKVLGFYSNIDDSPQPDQRVAAAQSEQRVRSALDQLSTEQLRVIELSFFEEKAHAEISQILKIPLGTVKSRLRLAMARLRILLGELS